MLPHQALPFTKSQIQQKSQLYSPPTSALEGFFPLSLFSDKVNVPTPPTRDHHLTLMIDIFSPFSRQKSLPSRVHSQVPTVKVDSAAPARTGHDSTLPLIRILELQITAPVTFVVSVEAGKWVATIDQWGEHLNGHARATGSGGGLEVGA